jgi:hypothetical protein
MDATLLQKYVDDGWVITDPSCNQMKKEIFEGKTYLFREDRIVNPETKEIQAFELLMDIDDYTWFEIIDACESFGYTAKQVDMWLTEGEEIDLILECLFELEA